MSYFARPNFIKYDEWFDENLKKTNLGIQNEKRKKISKIHKFFYEQSNYKMGGSENNFQQTLKVNQKEILSNKYFQNISEDFKSISHKKFLFFEKLFKRKIKFLFTNKLIYSLSILGFVFIVGFIIFFISSPRKIESNKMNKLYILEKEF